MCDKHNEKSYNLNKNAIFFSKVMMFWLSVTVVAILLYYAIDRIRRKPMLNELHKRYILVTGCDMGFGRYAVKRLDKMGCHVIAGQSGVVWGISCINYISFIYRQGDLLKRNVFGGCAYMYLSCKYLWVWLCVPLLTFVVCVRCMTMSISDFIFNHVNYKIIIQDVFKILLWKSFHRNAPVGLLQ